MNSIQLLTGCTLGKGNLILKNYGKQVYTFIKRPSKAGLQGEALRVSVDFRGPEETAGEKEMWRRFSGGDRSEEVLKAVHARRSKKINAIMGAADGELFTIRRSRYRARGTVGAGMAPFAVPPAASACARCSPSTSSSSALISGRTGAILTETIFSWPGIGKWMIDSISRRDYPSVQGGLLLIAGIVMVVNLIVDLLYGVINPRIRHARQLG